MNNSQVRIDMADKEVDITPRLNAEENRLLKIVEALQRVQSSKEWGILKTEVFANLENVLERELKVESEKIDPSPNKLNRIMGKLEWARRYSDLQKFENEKRIELQNIRKLNGHRTEQPV